MTVSYGFYDSVAGDRLYTANQFSAMMDGIINDGIFPSVGNVFFVMKNDALGGLNILVRSGRAWFDHTWTYNDADLPLVLNPAPISQDRIDCVVIETNSSIGVRANSIKVITGTPATNPVAPTMVRTSTINQYPLAQIYLTANKTVLTGAEITSLTGSAPCPFVTGILATVDIGPMVAQWEAQFTDWFNNIVILVNEVDAVVLQGQIDAINAELTLVHDAFTNLESFVLGEQQANISTLQGQMTTANSNIATINANPMLSKKWGVTLFIDNGADVITTGTKITTEAPFSGSVLSWTITSGDLTVGSISLILEKISYASFSGGAWTEIGTLALSAADKASGTFTGKSITEGDILRIRIASAPTSVKKIALSLKGLRT